MRQRSAGKILRTRHKGVEGNTILEEDEFVVYCSTMAQRLKGRSD
jgi:hypothetical protein